MMKHGSEYDRLTSRLDMSDPSACWHYQAHVTPFGYGNLRTKDDKGIHAHRLAYQVFVGPIPEGAVIDHECHNEAVRRGECEGGRTCMHRRCCNPAHLVATTQAKNLEGSVRCGHAGEFCNAGHPNAVYRRVAPTQTYCLECRRLSKLKRSQALKLAEVAAFEAEFGPTISVQDAAEILGVSTTMIHARKRAGEIRFIRPGSHTLLAEADVRKVPKSKKKEAKK